MQRGTTMRGRMSRHEGAAATAKARQKHNKNRQAKDGAFKGAAVSQDDCAESQNDGVPRSPGMKNARQRPSHQGTANRRHERPVVAVHPIAEDRDLEHDEDGADQGPPGREPSLEHPQDCPTHHAAAEQHADPGMAEQLTQRENRTLRGWILGHIGWVLVDVNGVKEKPHRMGRIGKPTVSEGVTCQEVTELIVDLGIGNREKP